MIHYLSRGPSLLISVEYFRTTRFNFSQGKRRSLNLLGSVTVIFSANERYVIQLSVIAAMFVLSFISDVSQVIVVIQSFKKYYPLVL